MVVKGVGVAPVGRGDVAARPVDEGARGATMVGVGTLPSPPSSHPSRLPPWPGAATPSPTTTAQSLQGAGGVAFSAADYSFMAWGL